MLQGINALYTGNDWNLVVPYIYINNQWQRVIPKQYNEGWKTLGSAGNLMVRFYTSQGEEFYDSNGDIFLVRDEDPVLQSIAVTTMPTKTTYLYEDRFDPTGMVITGTYSYKGTTFTKPIYDWVYKTDPLDLTDTTITISHWESNNWYSTTINLTIINTFDSITITTNPTKMIYANGSSFSPSGLVITATFAYNGVTRSTRRITSGFTYPASVTSTSATISYTFGNVTKSTTLSGITVYNVNQVLNYAYNGSNRSLVLIPGTYQLECWGAQGGYRSDASKGGKGGYAKGNLTVTKNTTVYIYAGSSGNTGGTSGGYNGGGSRGTYSGGGGGSDIRIGSTSLYARVIVAGGGGSDGASGKQGGYGGGQTGETRSESYGTGGAGGSQTAAGSTGNAGSFGKGGSGTAANGGYGGAGGGGWYGGSGIVPDGSADDERGGGGGSGYVYTSSTAGNYPSGCLLNSSYYLTNTSLVAGNSSFTDYSGSTVTGHSGDGACRITIVSLTI